MTGFVYLASPYTSPDPAIREQRYHAACRAAGAMMAEGMVVYSPIAHSHPVEVHIGAQQSHEFWMRQCVPLLRMSEGVVVLKLDGWAESRGVRYEIDLAHKLLLPVCYRSVMV